MKIAGFSAAEFKVFMQFFYFNEVELNDDNIAGVMGLADKYNISAGLAICTQFWIHNLTSDNVCIALKLAILCNQTELRFLCELRIESRTSNVLKSTSFLACDRRILGHILSMDRLSCAETKLFEATMRWVTCFMRFAFGQLHSENLLT